METRRIRRGEIFVLFFVLGGLGTSYFHRNYDFAYLLF